MAENNKPVLERHRQLAWHLWTEGYIRNPQQYGTSTVDEMAQIIANAEPSPSGDPASEFADRLVEIFEPRLAALSEEEQDATIARFEQKVAEVVAGGKSRNSPSAMGNSAGEKSGEANSDSSQNATAASSATAENGENNRRRDALKPLAGVEPSGLNDAELLDRIQACTKENTELHERIERLVKSLKRDVKVAIQHDRSSDAGLLGIVIRQIEAILHPREPVNETS